MCSCLRTAANRLTDSHCGLAGLLRGRSEDAEPAVGERNPSSSERPAGESADSGAVDDGACDATAGLELLQKARDAGGAVLDENTDILKRRPESGVPSRCKPSVRSCQPPARPAAAQRRTPCSSRGVAQGKDLERVVITVKLCQ